MNMNMKRVCFFALSLLTAVSLHAAAILVEAEAFADKGGWVVDQQFMAQMGSPFLMAHGLGRPVADAIHSVAISEEGDYHLWVRTRNWNALWNDTNAAGRFRLLINGEPCGRELGTGSVQWVWQKAGSTHLNKGTTRISLRDLTGFNGRCDAIFLTTDNQWKPVNDKQKLEKFRYRMNTLIAPENTRKFDFVVSGGGVAGVCAAISAARLGLKVALVQDRPLWGGNNSSEVRVHLGGRTNIGPYPRLGDVVNEIGPAAGGNAKPAAQYEDDRKQAVIDAEKNITQFLNTRAVRVEMDGKRIRSVIARHIESGIETRLTAPLFADCTGDGSIGIAAGAEYRIGRESRAEFNEPTAPEQADSMTMGSSVQWYSTEQDSPVDFPDIDWGIKFNDKNCEKVKMGEWTWETGMNRHQVDEFERVRDYGLLVVLSNWSFLKNRSKHREEYANSKLDWVAYVAGKRESYRLVGDLLLTEQDLIQDKVYADGTACTTWTIDLHYPDPKNTVHFPGNEFKSICKHIPIHPYPIPYRCFYARDVDNLFMAGRNISVTHVALGTIRVMRTTGMMGEVVGMAASLCVKHNCDPRAIYEKHLNDLKRLMHRGVGIGVEQPPQTYNMGRMKQR